MGELQRTAAILCLCVVSTACNFNINPQQKKLTRFARSFSKVEYTQTDGIIIGYNAPPHSLTLDRVNELSKMGLQSWRVVEPYDEGSSDTDHLNELIQQVLRNHGECIVTLLNSNPGVENVVSQDIWKVFLEKEKMDVGRARRALIGGGIRASNPNITNWIIREAEVLQQLLPQQVVVELWNADIYYWGTNWATYKPLEDWKPIFELLGSLDQNGEAFNSLKQKLEHVFEARKKITMGGFLYAERDGIHQIGPQDQIVEFGVNVITSGNDFQKALKSIPQGTKRIYLQWLVNPQWGWWILPLEEQEILWDPITANEFLAKQGREPDPYGLISVLGWQPIYQFLDYMRTYSLY